jgi:hydroxymethylpyrimidine pyrophosphatase-like HAD family hydrolase
MNPPLRLISTDFDGTLHSDTMRPPVPGKLQELLAELQTRGARWVINTGRDLGSLMESMGRARLEVHPDYLVLVEREIYLHEDHRYVPLTEWNERCAAAHARLFARIRPDLPRLMRWVRDRFDAEVYGDSWSPFCLLARTPEDAMAICDYLDDYCREAGDLTVVRNDVYARLAHADYSKGTALAEIAGRLGARPETTFAAGDHVNDLPMLTPDVAAHLAAPANAVPEVKETVRSFGGFVSRHPCGMGVAEALRRLVEN